VCVAYNETMLALWILAFAAEKPMLVFPKEAFGPVRSRLDRALDRSGTRARLARCGLVVFVNAEKKPAHDALADFHLRSVDGTLNAEVWFFASANDLAPASVALALAEKGRSDMHTTENGSFLVRVTGDPARVSDAVGAIAGEE
jgi:hypothetical protein